MTALLALGLVIAIQGVLCASTPCSGDIKAKTRDGITCYECGKSGLPTPTEQWSTVGKLTASPGNFPWSAVVYTKSSSGWDQACGGTLISSQAVLTTASCVQTYSPYGPGRTRDVTDLTVVLGKTNRLWDVNEPTAIQGQIKEIRVHPVYGGYLLNFVNNIAILLLANVIPFNNALMPACLDYDLNQQPLYENNAIGYMAGFGYARDCGPMCANRSETLMYTSTKVFSYDQCLEKILALDPYSQPSLTPEKFCIGNGTVSPIQIGDGGSGFTLISEGLHYVTGVASAKLQSYGGRYNFGGVTNVAIHMDWIKNNLPE